MFVRITGAGVRESHVHDVSITKEAPNYRDQLRMAGATAGRQPPRDIHAHRILILDFGAQYTQLIARRVREIGVYCEILPWDASEAEIRAFGARGIILSGGPESVTDAKPPRAPEPCSSSACRCSASATACRPWRSSSAAACAPSSIASSATRESTHGHVAPARRH